MARKDDTTLTINSIIGKDAQFVGDLFVKETTRIDGELKGNINSEGTIIVGTNGNVEGNIKAENVSVAGMVKGDIIADGKIEAAASAHIVGNITTKCLIIDENAVFQGNCNMKQSDIPVQSGKTVATKEKAATEDAE